LLDFHQQTELAGLYRAADVFVFPTLGDPYGLVVNEAMAAGLPIISTTAAGEIHDRVVDDVNGLLVPPNDVGALRRAMEKLGERSDVRGVMGKRSEEAIRHHTVENWAVEFEQAVTDIVMATRARRRRGS
jgi:glycosyltransferase involved in cell wall biosynthesis